MEEIGISSSGVCVNTFENPIPMILMQQGVFVMQMKLFLLWFQTFNLLCCGVIIWYFHLLLFFFASISGKNISIHSNLYKKQL